MSREFDETNRKSPKTCVIGLGNVGLPTAYHIHDCGLPVYGYDVDKRKILGLNPITAFSEWSQVPSCENYIVCVDTGWKDGQPAMSNVFDACRKIATKEIGNKPLVSIESTVAVGTCRKIAEMFDEVYLAHVPHRFWAEDQEEHGVIQERVIGAIDHESSIKTESFYKSLGIPLYSVSDLEVAELVKITENAYRFVQIAFVEQLRLLCKNRGMPFEEVRRGANTKWNVDLLEARDGVKGDCLPKDIQYLASLGDPPLLLGAMETDKKYIEYLESCKKHRTLPS